MWYSLDSSKDLRQVKSFTAESVPGTKDGHLLLIICQEHRTLKLISFSEEYKNISSKLIFITLKLIHGKLNK